jgi:hypothetical protein
MWQVADSYLRATDIGHDQPIRLPFLKFLNKKNATKLAVFSHVRVRLQDEHVRCSSHGGSAPAVRHLYK